MKNVTNTYKKDNTTVRVTALINTRQCMLI